VGKAAARLGSDVAGVAGAEVCGASGSLAPGVGVGVAGVVGPAAAEAWTASLGPPERTRMPTLRAPATPTSAPIAAIAQNPGDRRRKPGSSTSEFADPSVAELAMEGTDPT
jgi:hypothetical protein